MSRARFIAAARLEFLSEVIYYSETQAGLGGRFTAAVEEAAVRALAFPLAGSPYRSNTRRVLVKVIYVAKFAHTIYVLHAFQKKTQKTPLADIELSARRYKMIGVEP